MKQILLITSLLVLVSACSNKQVISNGTPAADDVNSIISEFNSLYGYNGNEITLTLTISASTLNDYKCDGSSTYATVKDVFWYNASSNMKRAIVYRLLAECSLNLGVDNRTMDLSFVTVNGVDHNSYTTMYSILNFNGLPPASDVDAFWDIYKYTLSLKMPYAISQPVSYGTVTNVK